MKPIKLETLRHDNLVMFSQYMFALVSKQRPHLTIEQLWDEFNQHLDKKTYEIELGIGRSNRSCFGTYNKLSRICKKCLYNRKWECRDLAPVDGKIRCPKCKRLTPDGRPCMSCRYLNRKRARKYYANLKCDKCHKVDCICQDLKNQKIKSIRARRKEAGLCVHCGNQRDNDTLQCQKCLETHRKHNHAIKDRRKEKGLCCRCGNSLAGRVGVLCNRCRQDDKSERQRRRDNGLCTSCGTRKAERGLTCERCRTLKHNTRKAKTGVQSAIDLVDSGQTANVSTVNP